MNRVSNKAAGLGCGMVNPLTSEPYLDRELVLRPFEPAIDFRTLLLLPPSRKPSLIVRDFIDEVMKLREVPRR